MHQSDAQNLNILVQTSFPAEPVHYANDISPWQNRAKYAIMFTRKCFVLCVCSSSWSAMLGCVLQERVEVAKYFSC